MENVTLQVEGMSCGGCVKNVEEAVTSLNGVERAMVDLETGKVTVAFDATKVTTAQVEEAIEDRGFDVVR